jgi:hypothetical protein
MGWSTPSNTNLSVSDHHVSFTPSDTVVYNPPFRRIIFMDIASSSTNVVRIEDQNGNIVNYRIPYIGYVLDLLVQRVWATGTTFDNATGGSNNTMIGLY